MKKLTSKKLRAELRQTEFYLSKALKSNDVIRAFKLNARLIGQAQVLLHAKGKSYVSFYNDTYALYLTNQRLAKSEYLPVEKAQHQLIANTIQEILVQL